MKLSARAVSIIKPRDALIVLGVVAIATITQLKVSRLPPPHPHAPEFALIARAGPMVQLHLFAVMVALGVGVALLIGVKGSATHKTLGWAWVIAMMTGAVASLFIKIVNHGAFSYIHLLSGWVIIALPMAVSLARRGKAAGHGRMMTSLFTGGLIIAGLLAFTPGRLMWRLFF